MCRRHAVCFVVLLATCLDVSAHGSSKSLGSFFGGVVHPLVEPAHLMALVSLMLCLGQRRLSASGTAFPCFLVGLMPGLIAAGLGWRPDTELLLLAIAAVVGISVAAFLPIPIPVLGILCLLSGAGIDLGSSPEDVSGGARLASLIGTCFGAAVWLFNGSDLVQKARRPWPAILVRVAGSWITASSVLVLALAVAASHAPPTSNPSPKILDTRR